MKVEDQIKNLLGQKFEAKRVNSVVSHYISCIQKFEEGDWETSLTKAGKFIEAVIKLLWVFAGKELPEKQKEFKATIFAQKIITQVTTATISDDGIRLQIPRASIFVYDITSNRGGRHDSDEVNANEMDSSTVLPVCSWILAELFRFSAKNLMSIEETKKIIDSLTERRYPIFEEIDGRIYVDSKKFKSAPECSLLILYKIYPKRISKDTLINFLKRHNFKQSAVKFERLSSYLDIDENDNILLRATGRRKAEEILNKN
ncbi:MAG: hypothetical protein A2744_01285 [Candidatus Buchananbacteria bacterium RIFCSPHIGHO2_01_FULL_44_11]|uniref:Uncharacterized protein n=1 Tax=Candidatus Buchananbacteria bacterium RIFCSPHIGHO2_01_FULL_44_11 TaxID=1797535 RepID=A0A1G1Y354_9BACT|nr:MAG: hypothetical protein A2744_01285 [Candidatus Buchananbacteria bacterium RIFCSPHIGHO2_01_FULL_44_11]